MTHVHVQRAQERRRSDLRAAIEAAQELLDELELIPDRMRDAAIARAIRDSLQRELDAVGRLA